MTRTRVTLSLRRLAPAAIPTLALGASLAILAALTPVPVQAEAQTDALVLAEAAPRDQALSRMQVREELAITRRALESLHPGYTRYTAKATLDALWRDVEAEALARPTRGSIYLQLSRVLAAIRCDHTKAEIPADFEEARKDEALYLPFGYAIFDGRMFVTDPRGTSLLRGTEIIAIDGRPVGEAIEAVFALFPVDGDTDHVKGESVVRQGEFVGPAFDHFYPFLYEFAPDATFTITGGEGSTSEVTLARHTYAQHVAATGEARFSRNFDTSVAFNLIDDTAAYLSVDTFVNYRRPVDPDTIYAPVFAQLAASGRDTLILDLRRNGGGSTDAQIGLVQWLMPAAFRQAEAVLVKSDRIDPAIRPYIDSWEKAALDPDPAWFAKRGDGMFEIVNPLAGKPRERIAAKPGAFTGRLIVLTSSDNASGVTHLLSVMRSQRPDTVFIGERTGGAATGATAGILAYLTLPHSGVKVRVPLQRTLIANADNLDPRGGITPDILAEDTRASVMAGTDPAMEAALRYLNTSL